MIAEGLPLSVGSARRLGDRERHVADGLVPTRNYCRTTVLFPGPVRLRLWVEIPVAVATAAEVTF